SRIGRPADSGRGRLPPGRRRPDLGLQAGRVVRPGERRAPRAAGPDAFAAHGPPVVEAGRRDLRLGDGRSPRERRRPVPGRAGLLRVALRQVGPRVHLPAQRDQRRVRAVPAGD
ncbi:hypothetical protein HK102_013103, partial [Quaeritorhiza haematococci]